MAFNLKNYETVKERKKRFYETNPDGRIVVNAERITQDEAVFYVEIYKNRDDQLARIPWATGYAQEFKGQGGMANKTSWCENCEESAVGRALDNAGYANHNGPSLEEMQKVERAERVEGKSESTLSTPLSNLVKSSPQNGPMGFSTNRAERDVGKSPSVITKSPEEFEIPFGEKGRILKKYSKEELTEMGMKLQGLVDSGKGKAMHTETLKNIDLVLKGRP
jgi:hypothetical protein